MEQKENEIESIKRDIESQKNRIYTAIDDNKSSMQAQISERDIVIEKLKTALTIEKTKATPKQSQERHWVIESNLRDIISEHKQKLIAEKGKNGTLEKEVNMYQELLVKTKVKAPFNVIGGMGQLRTRKGKTEI